METNRPHAAVENRKAYLLMDMRGTIHRSLKSDSTTVLAAREYDAFGRVISAILNNRFYIGFVTFRGQLFPGKHRAIIQPDVFERCQQLLHRKNHRVRKANHYLAGGLFVCAHCGYGITGERNRRDATLDAAGFASYFFFDQVGNLVRQRDTRGFLTYFSYDARDRQSSRQDAEGNYWYYAYDGVGNQTQAKDPRNYAWYYDYDDLNRQTSQTDPLSQRTYFGYDATGNLIRTRDRRGNAVYFGYDAANRRVKTKDAAGFSTYFGYDGNGNQVRGLDARLNPTYFVYDALNRQTRSLDTVGVIGDTAYDANGNVTRSSRGTTGAGGGLMASPLSLGKHIRHSLGSWGSKQHASA